MTSTLNAARAHQKLHEEAEAELELIAIRLQRIRLELLHIPGALVQPMEQTDELRMLVERIRQNQQMRNQRLKAAIESDLKR